jgi:AcrR family transcriptional regulator
MMELLSEKRYEAITVQDILDRAGIGRTTFYSHYYDKEDVHASMMEQMLEGMSQQLSESHTGHGFVPSLELFQHIQQDLSIFKRWWQVAAESYGKRCRPRWAGPSNNPLSLRGRTKKLRPFL